MIEEMTETTHESAVRYERDADGSMNRVGQVASGLRSSIGHPMEGEVAD